MILDPQIVTELRKAAAAMTPDDRAVERAFADQAYTAISNKVGPLMREENRLGFEIVQKNDDNTRMMGIWAFRAGRTNKDQLLYVPVCFVGGKVQGSDLLYRVGPKKFVCNTPDWARFLIEQSFQTAGSPIPKAEAGKTGPMFHGDRILRTPAAMGKMASDMQTDWQAVLSDMCKKGSTEGILKDFMERVGGLRAINTIERCLEQHPKFARAVARRVPLDHWVSDAIVHADLQRKKEASQDPVTLMLFTGAPSPELLSKAKDRAKVAAELYSKGFCFEEQFQDVPDSKTIVYGEPGLNLRSPLEPGVYDVMLSGGDNVRAAVGYSRHAYELGDRGGSDSFGPNWPAPSLGNPGKREQIVVRLASCDQGDMWRGTREIWALQGTDELLCCAGEPILDAGNGVGFLADPDSGDIYGPVEIKDKSKVGDITHLSYLVHKGDKTPRTLVINPDLTKSELERGFGTPTLRFIPRKPKPETDSDHDGCCGSRVWEFDHLVPGDGGDVHKLMVNDRALDDNFKKASLTRECDFNGTPLFYLNIHGRTTLPMTKLSMMVKLAGQLAIDPTSAEAMLDAVADNRTVSWTLELPAKHASSMLQLMDAPRFEQTIDNVQNVPMEVPQAQALRTVRSPIYRPASRIGDKYDPAKGVTNTPDEDGDGDHVPARIIMSSTPEEIAQYAETNALPHVFDHGMVASMARTYDMTHALDQYLPKMEDGLDALGRALLLFYWKPEDWKDMYGSDDRAELEGQLLSTFKGFGDLLLDLLKRSSHNARHPASS